MDRSRETPPRRKEHAAQYVTPIATALNPRKKGWVLITLMTAGLVIIIWGLAGPALSGVFQQAIDRVSGF
jgi:hypothetical protein